MIIYEGDLQAGDYVLNLNVSAPFAHKVTRVADAGTVAIDERVIQVSTLYGEDWVRAAAFFKLAGPMPTKDEIAQFKEARASARAAALQEYPDES